MGIQGLAIEERSALKIHILGSLNADAIQGLGDRYIILGRDTEKGRENRPETWEIPKSKGKEEEEWAEAREGAEISGGSNKIRRR